MKKTVLIGLLVIIGTLSSAQITLENSYPNSFDNYIDKDFGLVNLGNSNYKYYFTDYTNSQITLYNLNHSVYKNISIPWIGSTYHISYISNSLFECDTSTIEFLVALKNNITHIYDENGNNLFWEAGGVATKCGVGCPNLILTFPRDIIFNTPNGTKMILGNTDGSTKVYSLCGTLETVSSQGVSGITESEMQLFNAYPNPSKNSTRIDYNLPKGINEGELTIYNTNGQLIKKYKVDKQFNYITISIKELPSGVYYYSLETSLGVIKGKKMIKVD